MFNRKGSNQVNDNDEDDVRRFDFITYDRLERQFQILKNKLDKSSQNVIISGFVVKQDQIDGNFGFPTANVFIKNPNVKDGVYISRVIIKDNQYCALSFVDINTQICKTHILNFHKDIYGVYVKIELVKFLHNNIEYTSEYQKKQERFKDLEQVYKYFSEELDNSNKYLF